MSRTYLVIDLKSFYASVECVERGLDAMKAKLVVADPARTQKTICLAVSPEMKRLGVKNRCRVFEIPENLDYIVAPPRMQLYIDYAANIYAIYLKYVAKEDIHVYSIDEAFLDVTDYLKMYGTDARGLGKRIQKDILESTGIQSTCGIGTNLYLAKIALDITAKHSPDFIGELDEETYQRTLWKHRPLTDFWRIGAGTAKKLEQYGVYTMEGITQMEESLLYKLFGVDAELLIDHAYGRETTLISDIKNYRSKSASFSSGQVLDRDYEFEEGCLVTKEMADLLCLDLIDKGFVTDSITLHIGYSNALNVKAAHGSIRPMQSTNLAKIIVPLVEQLYREIINPTLPIRRISLSYNNLTPEGYEQMNLFCDPLDLEREHSMAKAMIELKKKFGKNAVLRGMNLEEGAKTIERNAQIGGHKANSELAGMDFHGSDIKRDC